MRKIIAPLAATVGAAALVLSAASPALAHTLNPGEQLRANACTALATDEDAVATYFHNDTTAASDDTCTVVSTATTEKESIEQVNSVNAKKAVTRVVKYNETVTTTLTYRWELDGGTQWVAASTELSDAEQEFISNCFVNPAKERCEDIVGE
jgi:hypothetical protein